ALEGESPLARVGGICNLRDVHDATPPGWQVGRPYYHVERRQWVQYSFDPSERPVVGLRSREWTAVSATEVECVREMARCLREIGEGRAPR
ncbi:MAG: hypothetical protein M3452_09240, partial [Chloroflexota bacterium]|nr:hypothetical protein [Chloroflexota bacterium]